ncbi:MAG: DUF2164 domain-containing protein [Firmicutes bacterium]|nr:DUF2164 domain-containing protein [Bacillota bacterium]
MDPRLKLSKEEKDLIVKELQDYFLNERDQEIGELAAVLLLDFVCERLGPIYFNRGLQAAMIYISERLDDLHSLEIWR